MRLGFLSSILNDYSFEDVIDTASDMGFKCIEVACWPKGESERRYAGVCHIDVTNLTDSKQSHIKEYCNNKNIEISSLAYYPNTMDGDLEKRNTNIEHLKKVILASSKLGINLVTTFIGKDQNKTIEENIEIFAKIWPPIVKYAEENGVKIAIENCPMLFGVDQWPGGQNLFSSPHIWRKLFEIIPNNNFGINFDPSHFVWQFMDYIEPIYEFKDRLFHIHVKDIKLDRYKLKDVGILAYPLEYMNPKIPGLGDVNWAAFISALTDVGYDGYICIEIEDRAFEQNDGRILDSLRLSKKYVENFII